MQKKFGYYTVGKYEFESKIQAYMYAEKANLKPVWHFNNEVFDRYDWSQEPELTLDQLYDRRAREIREQYDYVILSFSGGSDSNNIVESFIRQKLHIDEILTVFPLDISKEYTVLDPAQREAWNINAEYYLHTRERLKYVANMLPNTKITVLDSSEAVIKSFITKDDASWVKNKREVLNPNGTSSYNYIFFKDVRNRFDHQQRIALVIGSDKPRLHVKDDKFYIYFQDTVTNITQVQDHLIEYPNATPVFFYWDSDCCDMLCKQAHTVLKYIKANPHHRYAWESKDFKVQRWTQEELLKTILYTTWNPGWFQVKKAIKSWDSELDYWFTRGRADTQEYAVWLEGLKFVADRVQSFVQKEDDGSLRGLMAMTSKNYYVGDLSLPGIIY